MKRIIAGGTGFLGSFLVEKWLREGMAISVIGRDKQKITQQFGQNVEALSWDNVRQNPNLLKDAELILNLCGANVGTHRWSEKRKATILNSRVQTTAILSELCAKWGEQSPPLFNASAIGVYGLQNTPLDESTEIDFQHHTDFLSKVGRHWERATQVAKDAGVHVVNLRFGVVLGKGGGVLKKLYLPFFLGLGGPIGNGQQPFSWVAIDDVAKAIEFIFNKKTLAGPINITSPNCVSQREFASTLAKQMHRPSVMPMPGFMVKLLFGQMGDECLLQGQHILPARLQQSHFEFQYPTLEAALAQYL